MLRAVQYHRYVVVDYYAVFVVLGNHIVWLLSGCSRVMGVQGLDERAFVLRNITNHGPLLGCKTMGKALQHVQALLNPSSPHLFHGPTEEFMRVLSWTR